MVQKGKWYDKIENQIMQSSFQFSSVVIIKNIRGYCQNHS